MWSWSTCWMEYCRTNRKFDFFFFFFNEIDVRRRYTGKVHPLKVWIGPSIVKRRRRGEFYGLGRSWRCLWMRVLNSWKLKVISCGEDDGWEWVPVSGEIKELAKALVRILSNLTAKGCWAFEIIDMYLWKQYSNSNLKSIVNNSVRVTPL